MLNAIGPDMPSRPAPLSVELRTEQGAGGSLYLDFLNASRQRLEVFTQGGRSEGWQRIQVSGQAPAGTYYIRIALYSSNKTQGIIYWDNVKIIVGKP